MAQSKPNKTHVQRKRMPKTPPSVATPATVTMLSNCTRMGIMAALVLPGAPVHEASVWVAAATLASIEAPHGPIDLVERCTVYLAGTGIDLAGEILWHFAENSPVAGVRIAALKKVGPFVQSPERKILVRKWAQESFPIGQMLAGERLGPQHAQAAALNALARFPTFSNDDHDVVLRVTESAIDTPTPELFDGTIDALWSVVRSSDLPTILTFLDKCRDPRRAVALLSVAAKFDVATLAGHAQRLRTFLLRFTNPWHEREPFADRLAALAEKLSGKELLDEIPQTDVLNVGRGKLWTAAIAGYGPVDELVAATYVKFAREPVNLGSDSPAIAGLATCARSGFGELIAVLMVSQSAEGHKQLVMSPLLLQVFGSLEAIIIALASGLSRMNDNRRLESSQRCAAGILLCSVHKQGQSQFDPSSSRWIWQRWQQDHHSRNPQEIAKQLAATLGGDTEGVIAFDLIARLVRDGENRAGAVALLQAMLFPFDELAVLALKALLRAAAAIDFLARDGLPQASGLIDFLPITADQSLSAWLRRGLPEYFSVEGRLNRFAILLWEELNPQFPAGLESPLNAIRSAPDADFLLDAVVRTPKAETLRLLSRGASFHASDGGLTHHVRKRSIQLLVDVQRQIKIDDAALAPCRTAILDRFADVKEVRCAAYEACGALEDVASIKPLRSRLSTENTAIGKAAIQTALRAIRERLVREKPAADNIDKTVEWLNHAAELSDPATLEEVSCFLSPAHPHREVQIAAVKTVGAVGNKQGLEVLRQFVDDTLPSGDLLAAARRARLSLEDRSDAELFDELRKVFGEESELLDPAIDYASAINRVLLAPFTKGISEAWKRREVGHWDDFVTRLDGITEMLVRELYRRKYADFGLSKEKAEGLTKGNYSNLINVSQFKDFYPGLHAQCDLLHSYRREAPAAHAANSDGTEKAGVSEQDAEIALTVFREAIRDLVGILRRPVT